MNRREFLKAGLVGTDSNFNRDERSCPRPGVCSSGALRLSHPVYRTLGRTGLKITVVSFGAMLTPEAEVMEIAFDHGINYVDTARKYMGGKNEEIVGKALKGRRDRVYRNENPALFAFQRGHFQGLETSLKALETDYIDVIQLHNLTDGIRIFDPESGKHW